MLAHSVDIKSNPQFVLFNVDEEFVDSGEESDVEADEHSPYPNEVLYPSARIERSTEVLSGLPSTVEVLSTDDGCRVYLVGTAHFSESSQQDVIKVNFCHHLHWVISLFGLIFC